MKKINRRKFIKNSSLTAATAITTNFIGSSYNENIPPSEGKYMGDFSAPKINNIRVAFIGVGARGSGHLTYFGGIPNIEVVAISDLYQDNIENSINRLKNKFSTKNFNKISKYWGEENKWKLMLEEIKPDVIFISTNWLVWSGIILLLMRNIHHPPILHFEESLAKNDVLIGVISFIILILCFIPIPFKFNG